MIGFHGLVSNIKPYGAFIKVNNNVTGVLYKKDISIIRLKSPSESLKIGEKIDVIVKKYNKDTGKLILSCKEQKNTPRLSNNDLKENDKVIGIVRNKFKNRSFYRNGPNLVGLADIKPNVSCGDEINVIIKKISPETKKIKLEILD